MKLDDPIKVGDVEIALGWVQWAQGDRQASLGHLHRALSILEEKGETKELASVIGHISRMHMLASEHDQAITWGERGLALAERLDVGDAMVHTLNTVGVSRIWTGDVDKGLVQLQESLRLSLAFDHKFAADRAYFNLGEALMALGRHAEARATFEAYHEHSLRTGGRTAEASALIRLSFLDWQCGSWASSLDRIPKIKETVVGIFNVWAHHLFGWMDNDLGRTEKACQELESLLSSALRTGEIQTAVPYLGQLARAYAVMGKEPETTRIIRQYIDLIDGNLYFDTTSLIPLLFACQWFASESDTESLEACRASVDRLERAYEQFHFPESEAALAEGRGYLGLAEGNASLSVEHFQKAVGVWEAQERPYDQARALGGLGRAQAMADNPQAAELAFDLAMQQFQTLADQLENAELRTSFLSSELVDAVRKARAAIDTNE